MTEELFPNVVMSGRKFQTYSYYGIPPRVGDEVSLAKSYRGWQGVEGVVECVTWNHTIEHTDDGMVYKLWVDVRVREKETTEKKGVLSNFADKVRKLGGINEKKPSFVYFIANPSAGMVKIGYSTDLAGRLASLQTSHHSRLEILFAMPGTEATEAWLHQKFSTYRAEGEWFRFEGALKTYVDLMVGEF